MARKACTRTNRKTNQIKWTGTRVDLIFVRTPSCVLSEVYASADSQEKLRKTSWRHGQGYDHDRFDVA